MREGARADRVGEAGVGEQRDGDGLAASLRVRHTVAVPTILSHPAVALGLRGWLGRRPLPRGVAMAGVIGAVLPDADVIGFALHVPYGSPFGHRGFTHSIAFAMIAAVIAALVLRRDRRTFAFVFLCTLSHPLFDALTDGGLGVAFFAPFSNHRYFFPWRPIRVSPIGRFDLGVFASEVCWVWLPCIAAAIGATIVQARAERRKADVPPR
jgi:inner membrane protein